MSTPLTDRQAQVLRHIAEHIVRWQRPPTRSGIAAHFGWASPNAADQHLRYLELKGYIELDAPNCNDTHGARYPRVLRWPEGLAPVIHVSAATAGPTPEPA